jgi:hypothetical protein
MIFQKILKLCVRACVRACVCVCVWARTHMCECELFGKDVIQNEEYERKYLHIYINCPTTRLASAINDHHGQLGTGWKTTSLYIFIFKIKLC